MDKPEKKLRLLFNGSVLANGLNNDSGRSGIFYMTYQLLRKFSMNNDIDICVYLPHSSNIEVKQLIQKEIIPASCETIYSYIIPNCFFKLELFCKKNNEDNLLKKIVRFMLCRYKRISRFFCLLELKKQLKSGNYNIYFTPNDNIPRIIQNIQNIQKYMIIHDLIPIILDDYYEKFNIMRMKNMKKILYSLSPDNTYFAVSESTKRDLVSCNKNIKENQVVVAYPSANHYKNSTLKELATENVREKYKIPKNKKYVLSLCSIEPRKNTIFSIKNYLNFVDKHKIDDLIFVVGGGIWKEYSTIFSDFINSLPKDKIMILDYVNDEDLFALYSEAFIFTGVYLYEGFGVPVLEAMACGCPVITSNTSSLPEVIGDAGIQIDPTNDEEMIQAYEKMYFDTRFRGECIEKGLERAKQFSWEKCADIMIEQFKKDLSE